ncbi:MAG: DUF4138 domain-containing protein [Chitinophagaceae bacterium]|nr:DUF4138 domain-containing protein [Chitinophagaceae bacterium]
MESYAQVNVRPHVLQVTVNKTTSIIFPSAITSIDRGSERIVVQKSTGNVLRVKADSAFADTTNLTVITANGKLYSFLVNYEPSPALLTIDLGAAANITQDTGMLSLAGLVMKTSNQLHGVRYGSGKVKLSLVGIYTNGSVIACKLRIENASPFSFEIGRIGALVSGSHGGKRRATHEQEVSVLLTDIEVMIVRERQAGVCVVLLPKSGLSPGQQLHIQVNEKGGERHLSLSIPNRYLLNAYLISVL